MDDMKVDITKVRPCNIKNSIYANKNVNIALKNFIGKPVYLVCGKHDYAGFVSSVNDDNVVLVKAIGYIFKNDESHVQIGEPVIVLFNSIELIYQPDFILKHYSGPCPVCNESVV